MYPLYMIRPFQKDVTAAMETGKIRRYCNAPFAILIVPLSLKVSVQFSENLFSYQKNLINTCGQIVKIVNVLSSSRNNDIVRGVKTVWRVSSRYNMWFVMILN